MKYFYVSHFKLLNGLKLLTSVIIINGKYCVFKENVSYVSLCLLLLMAASMVIALNICFSFLSDFALCTLVKILQK